MRFFFFIILVTIFGYEIHAADTSPQAARILKQLNGLQRLVKTQKPLEDYLTIDVAQKMRAHAFNLEELLRIYEAEHPKKLKGLFAASKELEDAIGHYVDGVEHVRLAEKMGVQTETLNFLKGKEEALRDNLIKVLTQGKHPWIASRNESAFTHFREAVESVNWEGKNRDRKTLIEHLQDLYTDIQDTHYDLSKTQGKTGLHQLRRDLRKTIILMLTLNYDGKLVTYDKDIPEFKGKVRDKAFTESKYGKLPRKKPSDLAILIPYSLYLAAAKKVQDLGSAKDVLEAEGEWLPQALIKSGEIKKAKGETQAQFNSRLRNTVRSYMNKIPEWKKINVPQIKKAAEKFFDDSGFLEEMDRRLEKQSDWSKDKCRSKLRKLGL